MNLMEIERQIMPLGRPEKVRLMHLLIDEIARDGTERAITDVRSDTDIGEVSADMPDPAHYFRPGDSHVVGSPYDEHKAAYQLQQMLEEHHQ